MVSVKRRWWSEPDQLLPWVCVVAVVGRLAAVAIAFPPGDGDRFWQRWLGERIIHEHAIPRTLGPETFSAPGAPWIPQEWLFSTALAFSSDRGVAWLVPLACALIVGVALVMVVLRCQRRGLSGPMTSAAVMLCSLATVQSFGVRAQIVSWAGAATVLWLLEFEGPLAWVTVPVTMAWANLHASAFLAPAISALFALSWFRRGHCVPVYARRYTAIAFACGLVTLATPLGIDLPRYAVGLLASPIRHSISEWGATGMGSVAFILGAFPLVLVLVAFGVRASVRDRIVATAFTILLFAAVRNVPVFAFAMAPIALAAIPQGEKRNTTASRVERLTAWVTVGAAAMLAVVIPVASWRAAPAQGGLPVGPARALLSEARTPPRVFCEDFAWCSLFLADSRPAQFFMDGRADPYPITVWREYLRVLNGNAGWAKVLDANRIDAVLVRRDSALDSLLAEIPGTWREIAADRVSRLYARPPVIEASRQR